MIKAWQLPWTAENVPHGVLDINRGCNITCRACYNEASSRNKSLEEITTELDIMTGLRRIDSLSVAGGEVTLHPQLPEIVKLIKDRGISVEIFTNGLLLDDALLNLLKNSGADLIFLHIEPSQRRNDLPDSAGFAACRELIETKVAMINERGMETGVVLTVHDDHEFQGYVDMALENPAITYLLFTIHRDNSRIDWVKGDVLNGMQGKSGPYELSPDQPDINGMAIRLNEQFRLTPFAELGSNRDNTEIRWLSYLVGVSNRSTGKTYYGSCRAGLLEKLYLRFHYLFKRRYPFYTRQNLWQFRLQLLLNALSGGRLFSNLKILMNSFLPGSKLKTLRILLQQPAEVSSDGSVIHCRNCPDATIKNGRLAPLCLTDKITGAQR